MKSVSRWAGGWIGVHMVTRMHTDHQITDLAMWKRGIKLSSLSVNVNLPTIRITGKLINKLNQLVNYPRRLQPHLV
jgi:hypothetical protein